MKNWLLALALCSSTAFAAEVTPTVRVHQSLNFIDDMNFANLDLAIARQLAAYNSAGLSGDIRFGTLVYPKKVLKDSLILLKALSASAKKCQLAQPESACLDKFNLEVNEQFAIYKPIPSVKDQATHFTSYYSPDLNGSRVQTERYNHAIYNKPSATHLQNFSRVEIDFKNALSGKGHEIFWVEQSFFDLYLLHVQGGGRINIENADGTKEIKYLSYTGSNGQRFKMISHYMLAQGYLKPEDKGVPAQRKFLQENPSKEEEIFGSCPSYIYFKESNEEPVGLDNIPLTEGRSVALDAKIYKTTGLINFVKTSRASHIGDDGQVVKVPFSRFFIAQDTGGAIKGNARCDLYFGYGPLAELTAYSMDDMGEQYFLIKK